MLLSCAVIFLLRFTSIFFCIVTFSLIVFYFTILFEFFLSFYSHFFLQVFFISLFILLHFSLLGYFLLYTRTKGIVSSLASDQKNNPKTLLTFYGPCIVINLCNKNQRDALSFKFIPINILYMFRTDKLFILRRKFTVQAVYGIYRASTLTGY
jgi:hypothetical protein